MIRAVSKTVRFQTEFTNGEYVFTSDATLDKGGANQGFRPHELLEAALASCMNMTLRMCAEKNAIPLAGVSVIVSLNRDNPDGPLFEYRVDFQGSLSESQKECLLSALERCPVRTTLSRPLYFSYCK